MTALTALCTLLAVGALLMILGYIAWQGIGSLNFRFLVDIPRPVGEGGGIGNAIVGSLVLLLLSSVFGLPIGICVGVYLSEVGRGRLGGVVRFMLTRAAAVSALTQASSAIKAILYQDGLRITSEQLIVIDESVTFDWAQFREFMAVSLLGGGCP